MSKSNVDTQKLRRLIKDFKFHTRPSNGMSTAPCTVQDINKVIDNVAKVLTAFVDELEHAED